jgi:hypothetical protein
MNDEILQSQNGTPDLKITPELMMYLSSIATWAKFLAIVGFVVVGLLVVIAICVGAFMSSMNDLYGAMSGVSLTIIYLIIAVIYFFPVMFGYKFAIYLRNAIRSKDTPKLTESFKNLSYYCLYIGVLTIIGFVMLVVGIIVAIIGAAFVM